MAITTITNSMVSVNAIQGTLIADNAITAVHIASNAVASIQIAENNVTAREIAANTITVAQLADDSVEADKIADGVITTNHLNKAMISSQTEVTPVAGDFVLLGDTSDSNNLKKSPLTLLLNSNVDLSTKLNLSGGTMTGDLLVKPSASGATATSNTVGTFESNDNTEVSILGGSSSVLALNFGHSGDNDEGKITFNTTAGSEDLQIVSSKEITLDAAGDIILDADGSDIIFKDAGTSFGKIQNSSTNMIIESLVSNKDILFYGNDGGASVLALTLDMSAAGAAKFNSQIGVGAAPLQDAKLDLHTAGSTAKPLAIRITNAASTNYAWEIWRDNTNGDLNFGEELNGTDTTRVTFESGGKVGIGTTSPNAQLEVKIAARTADYQASNASTWGDIVVANPSGATSDATGIAFYNNASYHTNAATGIAVIKDSGSSDYGSHMAFITRPHAAVAVERMRIASDGAITMAGTLGVTGVTTIANTDSGQVNNESHVAIRNLANGNVITDDGLKMNCAENKLTVGGGTFITSGHIRSGAANMVLATANQNPHITIVDANGRIDFGESSVSGQGTPRTISHNSDGRSYITGGAEALYLGGATASESGRSNFRISEGNNNMEATIGGDISWVLMHDGKVKYNNSSNYGGHGNFIGEVGTNMKAVMFERTAGGGEVGSIVTNASSTTYNTSSDYRLKENVDYTWDATTRLKQLKPARFNWISDDSNTLLEGFLAHEVSSIVPEAVYGTKDGMSDPILYIEGENLPEGKSVGDTKVASAPDYQGIDHSKLVPLLVKAIQELEARIETLEG